MKQTPPSNSKQEIDAARAGQHGASFSKRALHFAPQKSPLWLNWGKHTRFVLRRYVLSDARIHDEVRLAIVSDLHGARYGEGQGEIVSALTQEDPHAVLLLGDIFDHRGIDGNAKALVSVLSSRFACYFIPGNHEHKSGELRVIQALIQQANIPILAGDSAILTINNTRVQLFGVDDGQGGELRQIRQIVRAGRSRESGLYSILAIHVPNRVNSFLRYGFDLVLSGHTHGGQFVIPHLVNGLYAPGQGVFPKFGGGKYVFESQTLIVSRGLSQKPLWLPRLGNPPELCLVTLQPKLEQ